MPVDIASGAVELTFEDVALPGRVSLVWDRRYGTGRVGHRAAPFGSGWANRYFATLTRRAGGFDFLTPLGGIESIDDPDRMSERGGRAVKLGAFLELFQDRGSFVVQQWNVESGEIWRYVFEDAPPGVPARLIRVEDVTGAALDVLWDERGRLIAIHQRAERRTLGLSYTAAGLVHRVVVQTADLQEFVLARYEYDAAGRLAAAFDAADNADRYEYDEHGRLIREIVKDGGVFGYRYDPRGRCVWTSGLDRYDQKRLRFLDAGGVTEVTDSYGATRLYQYLPTGQITRESDPLGGERTTAYDEHGRIVAQTDATGAVTSYAYDEQGNRALILDALGNAFRFEYDAQHQPVAMIDAREQRWRREYDARNRLIATVDPLGNRIEIAYDAAGNLAEVTNALGARQRQSYVDGRLTGILDWAGNVTRVSVDALGRVTEVASPLGEITQLRYDARGNNTEIVLADGSMQRAVYDAASNLVAFTDGEGHTTRFRFGPCRRLLERVDPSGGVLRYVWGTEPARLERVVNEKGETHTLVYDAAGRVVEEHRFDGGSRTFEFDAEGYSVAYTTANGERITLQRDALHRVMAALVPGVGTITYAFDADGHLVAAGSDRGEVTFERDALGRVVREGQGARWVESSYDAAGNLVHTATSLGHAVDYEYDANGGARRLSVLGAQSWILERDVTTQETARTLPGGARLEQRYDRVGRMAAQWLEGGTGRGRIDGGTAAALAARNAVGRRYAYDRRSAVISVLDERRGRADYAFDRAERLLRAQRDRGPSEAFAYDAAGNLTLMRVDGDAVVDDVLVYGAGDRVLEKGRIRYEYDPEGRRVARVELVEGAEPRVWRYEWDALDHLRAVVRPDGEVWRYEYDALGRRVEKSGPAGRTCFVWDREALVHEARDGEEPAAWIYDPDRFEPLATVQGARVYSVIADHLGTPRELVDRSGAVVLSIDTLSWGAAVSPTSTNGRTPRCPIRFLGQWADDESGLAYNHFRYYDPDVGAFISKDPVEHLAGTNFYRYVRNPIGWTDPWGLTAAPSSLPNTPGIYVVTNGNQSYVGSAGLGAAGMNDRLSASSDPAQALLGKPGTTVQFVQVDMGTATDRSDRNNIVRFYEQREYQKQLDRGFSMLNSPRAPPQSADKRSYALGLIKKFGASASSRRSTCR